MPLNWRDSALQATHLSQERCQGTVAFRAVKSIEMAPAVPSFIPDCADFVDFTTTPPAGEIPGASRSTSTASSYGRRQARAWSSPTSRSYARGATAHVLRQAGHRMQGARFPALYRRPCQVDRHASTRWPLATATRASVSSNSERSDGDRRSRLRYIVTDEKSSGRPPGLEAGLRAAASPGLPVRLLHLRLGAVGGDYASGRPAAWPVRHRRIGMAPASSAPLLVTT